MDGRGEDRRPVDLGNDAPVLRGGVVGLRMTTPPQPEVELVGALRTKGVVGLVYWRALWPIHRVVFKAMSRRKAPHARCRPYSRTLTSG